MTIENRLITSGARSAARPYLLTSPDPFDQLLIEWARYMRSASSVMEHFHVRARSVSAGYTHCSDSDATYLAANLRAVRALDSVIAFDLSDADRRAIHSLYLGTRWAGSEEALVEAATRAKETARVAMRRKGFFVGGNEAELCR